MFLWHHYFLTGLFHLLVLVLYDNITGNNLLTETPGVWILVWLLWPIFDAAFVGTIIKELLWKKK